MPSTLTQNCWGGTAPEQKCRARVREREMWSIRLKGETLDLQLLQQMLIAAELNIRQNDGNYYLTGRLFDQLADAEEVQAFARDLIQKINGAGKVGIDGY